MRVPTLLLSGLMSACYSSPSTLGLPCTSHEECDVSQFCTQGVCGWNTVTSSTSEGGTTADSATTSGETTGGTGSSTSGSTTTGVSAGSSSSTTGNDSCGAGGPDPGEQPDTGLYADCTSGAVGICAPSATQCVFQPGGTAWCTDECEDTVDCKEAPAGFAQPICLVGLCALDCSCAPCPFDMQCDEFSFCVSAGGRPPAYGEMYSDCTAALTCTPGLACLGTTVDGDFFCAGTSCVVAAADCDPSPQGYAQPTCQAFEGYCALDCSSGEPCPWGMECTDLMPEGRICI